MKLVTFQAKKGARQIGALTDEGRTIAVLQSGMVAMTGKPSIFFNDMISFLRGGKDAFSKAQSVVRYIIAKNPPKTRIGIDRVTLLAPVPIPESIRDCMSFEQHIINSIRKAGLKKLARMDELIENIFGRKRSIAYLLNKTWYRRPIYYKGNRFSVTGPGQEVKMPPYTAMFDYELEWGVFINRQGTDIPAERAHEYIGGYTIFNDFSARDMQLDEQGGRLGPAKGKDFDTGNVMGPCLVTPDEIADPYNLTMTARVNGAEWSRGNTRDMHWTFEDIISYVSQSETIYPGEFIGSGTCSGAQGKGCGLEMGTFLSKGDIIELEVQGIGVLRNRVI